MYRLNLRSARLRRSKRRRAFTLVEVLVAATLSSLILGISLSLLHSLLLSDRKLRDRPLALEQSSRLADELRREIRRAADVTRPDEKRLVIHISTDERIEYELTPPGCQRRGAAADTTGARADLFSIGGGLTWHVERQRASRIELVTVMLQPGAESEMRSGRPLLWVVAALGADREITNATSNR